LIIPGPCLNRLPQKSDVGKVYYTNIQSFIASFNYNFITCS